MSKADDELYGLKSSRTGEYINTKTADYLFEELGYKKIESKSKIIYVKDYESIDFLLQYKKIEYSFLRGTIFKVQDIAELQAINEKVKELGWNENN